MVDTFVEDDRGRTSCKRRKVRKLRKACARAHHLDDALRES